MSSSGRLPGLDGVRGLAALFVVLHHCWLLAFAGRIDTQQAPWWSGWLAYGHLAVVVFIVLSGFSLAVGPVRAGWRLRGTGEFFRRRAWRILPPYWAALAFSLLVAWTVVPQPGESVPTGRSVLVHGLLLQDTVGSPSPNGAFWSIAIEAHLYLLMPLLLLVARRAGPLAMIGPVAVAAVAVQLLADRVRVVALFERFVPQLAVLFTVGAAVAWFVAGPGRARWSHLPWAALAAAAAVPPLVLIAVGGRTWTVTHFFWVDLAVGPAVALLLVALSLGRPAALVGLLDTAALRGLGSFSYSLYLVHAPIVVAVAYVVVDHVVPSGVGALLVRLATAAPLSVLFARGFAAVFELPFQRLRSWRALVAALRSPRSALTGTAGGPPPT